MLNDGWLPVEIWYEFDILNCSRFPSAGMPNPYHTNFKWKFQTISYCSVWKWGSGPYKRSQMSRWVHKWHMDPRLIIFGSPNPGIEVSQCLTVFDDMIQSHTKTNLDFHIHGMPTSFQMIPNLIYLILTEILEPIWNSIHPAAWGKLPASSVFSSRAQRSLPLHLGVTGTKNVHLH